MNANPRGTELEPVVCINEHESNIRKALAMFGATDPRCRPAPTEYPPLALVPKQSGACSAN